MNLARRFWSAALAVTLPAFVVFVGLVWWMAGQVLGEGAPVVTLMVQVMVPLGLLSALFIAVGVRWMAERVTRDLRLLRDHCGEVDLTVVGATPLRVDVGAAPEVRVLADELAGLAERAQALVVMQSRFTAEAAHELRSPLTALYGELSLALRRDREAGAYRAAIEAALVDVMRLRTLTEALMAVARDRERAADLAITDVGSVCREAVEALGDVTFEIGLGADWPRVALDRVLTLRVLENLLANVDRHAKATRVLIEWRDGALWLVDDGVGLPANIDVFEPFLHAGEQGGAGLGLYIARELMRHQGGELESTHIKSWSGAAWALRW